VPAWLIAFYEPQFKFPRQLETGGRGIDAGALLLTAALCFSAWRRSICPICFLFGAHVALG